GFGGPGGGFGGPGGGFGGAGGGFGGPGGPGGAGGPGGQGARPGSGQGLSAFLPQGTELIPFVQTNSILVLGTPAAIDEARTLINLLDVPRQLIRLRVKKLLVRENQGHSVGVDYSLGSPVASISTNTGANLIAGTLNVFLAQNNISVKLLALESSSNARTVAEPTILTANGVGVFVSDFTQNLAVIPGASAGFGGQGTPPQVIPTGLTGIGLQILPRLMRDGTIEIYSSITDNGQIGQVTVPGGTPIPIQSNVSFPIPGIPVPNGGTMMVGGFVSHDQSHDRTAVPILGDLPLIGGLFRTVNDTSSDTETLYFISAELIDVNGQPIPGGPDAVRAALGGAATTTATTGTAGELPPPGGLTNGTTDTGAAPPLPPPTPVGPGGV
ncbi:MAG: hypothetical protein LC772_01390, partial [Chloroflexi bacterium]|nr:hypothetical protein [Chloroflexota bacterium]